MGATPLSTRVCESPLLKTMVSTAGNPPSFQYVQLYVDTWWLIQLIFNMSLSAPSFIHKSTPTSGKLGFISRQAAVKASSMLPRSCNSKWAEIWVTVRMAQNPKMVVYLPKVRLINWFRATVYLDKLVNLDMQTNLGTCNHLCQFICIIHDTSWLPACKMFPSWVNRCQ